MKPSAAGAAVAQGPGPWHRVVVLELLDRAGHQCGKAAQDLDALDTELPAGYHANHSRRPRPNDRLDRDRRENPWRLPAAAALPRHLGDRRRFPIRLCADPDDWRPGGADAAAGCPA